MRKSRFSATQIAEILKEAEAGVSVIEVLNEIVARRPRWGFWKLHDRLQLDGHRVNHKRLHRVYCALVSYAKCDRRGQPGDRGPRASGSNGMSMRNFQPINRHAGSLLSSAMGERFSRRHSARFV